MGSSEGHGAGGLTSRRWGRGAQHVLLLPVFSVLTHPKIEQSAFNQETSKRQHNAENDPLGLLALHVSRHAPIAVDLKDDQAGNQNNQEDEIERGMGERCIGKEARVCPVGYPYDHEKASPSGDKLAAGEKVEKDANAYVAGEFDALGQ